MQNQKYLLPVGFYDLLGDEARVNQETIDVLLNSFYGKKYQLIKTPLVEFEQSLSGCSGIDSKIAGEINDQSFKTIDNLSGKTLVIRSDITPQIARLMATKLHDAEMPVRLCYVGDVLKIENNDLYADRQLTQVGVELIGEDSCVANLEVIELTLTALKKIKLSNLVINFCWPQFLNILLAELGFENNSELKNAVSKKNISAIKNLAGKYSEALISLALENDNLDKIVQIISALPISDKTKNQLEKWQETVQKIKNKHSEIKFSVDVFGDEESSYHQQIAFTIFSEGFSYPIARGGRYLINQAFPAIGATIYINNLRKILTKK
jgi:ATP phosphoribosyltransferase regulatory subunit